MPVMKYAAVPNAFFSDSGVHVVRQIAGQRCDQMHPALGKPIRETGVTGLKHNGQIRPHDHAQVHRQGLVDEFAAMWVHLRRAAGDVQRLRAGPTRREQNIPHCLPSHLFFALGRRFDVTMSAGKIAPQADVGLNRVDRKARQRSVTDSLDRPIKGIFPRDGE